MVDASNPATGAASVHVERHGPVVEIILDNPPVNALTTSMIADIHKALDSLVLDATRAVVLRSSRIGIFVAGGDLGVIADGSIAEQRAYVSALQAVFARVAALEMPVLSVIDGHCIGGGVELALAGDLILCSPGSSFSLPEARLGIIPAAGGVHRLVRRVGEGPARLILLTGRTFHALEAHRLGLVDQVVPPSDLLEAARELARDVAQHPSAGIAAIKKLVANVYDSTLDSGLASELDSWMSVRPSAETEAAVRRQLARIRRD